MVLTTPTCPMFFRMVTTASTAAPQKDLPFMATIT